MNSTEWIVVIAAFIGGYSIVSFVFKRLNSQSQEADSGDRSKAEDGAYFGGDYGDDRNDTYSQREERGAEPFAERWESRNLEERYARVLGLSPTATATEVKRAYRKLLSKYHPDKVVHLGPEFKGIAEEKTREILEAYEYFCKKHHLR